MSEWEAVARLAVAAVLGGIIGFERETVAKAAGLRTHMLVSLGAALFMTSAILLIEDYAMLSDRAGLDPTRVASTIVTGIGFLGGGIIFKSGEHVQGMTTAAGLWVAAGIGLATGSGFYITAIGSVALAMIILVVIRRIEVLADLKTPPGNRSDDHDHPSS